MQMFHAREDVNSEVEGKETLRVRDRDTDRTKY